MKKLFSLLAMLAMVATISFAQNETTPVQVDKSEIADEPQITFESLEVDYGTIEQKSDPLRVFKFTNTGDKPVVISNAKGSCGCTVPQWPREPIMSGEDGVIEVRYDTKRVGPFSKRITLTVEGKKDPIRLTIKGKVNKKATEPAGVPAKATGVLNGKK